MPSGAAMDLARLEKMEGKLVKNPVPKHIKHITHISNNKIEALFGKIKPLREYP